MTTESLEPHCCPVSEKKKYRDEKEKKSLIHRLNRIEGQIRGIRGMVERDAYCPDVLIQVAAASAAMNSFARSLLQEHARSCVTEEIRAGNDEAVEELLRLMQKFMR